MSNDVLREKLASTVCSSEQSVVLDPAQFCGSPSQAISSPIDVFQSYLAAIVLLGDRASLDASQILGKALLLGVISAAEQYFRSVIAGLIDRCPKSRQSAATVNIAFGAIDYYVAEDLGFAFLEGVSLATPGEIGKQTAKITGLNSAQGGSAGAAIKEYEKLYHLRHAAVHSRGEFGSQNLRELGIRTGGKQELVVTWDGFQLACAVCLNAVRAYNRAIYAGTMERLVISSVLTGHWRQDRAVVRRIHMLFFSSDDLGRRGDVIAAYRALIPLVLKRLNTAPSMVGLTSTSEEVMATQDDVA